MNQKEPPLELIKTWIASVIEGINECVDDDTKKEILENCGKVCAIYHGHLEKIASMKEKSRNLEEILAGVPPKLQFLRDKCYDQGLNVVP